MVSLTDTVPPSEQPKAQRLDVLIQEIITKRAEEGDHTLRVETVSLRQTFIRWSLFHGEETNFFVYYYPFIDEFLYKPDGVEISKTKDVGEIMNYIQGKVGDV